MLSSCLPRPTNDEHQQVWTDQQLPSMAASMVGRGLAGFCQQVTAGHDRERSLKIGSGM
jgi:hypothetical protein